MAYVKAAERRGQLVAAARVVLARDGVASTTLRAVSSQARVPLGTLHYVFPSKELLLTAVVEDVRQEVSAVLESVKTDAGLDHAIAAGLESYWQRLVVNDPGLALMRHELFVYALRTPGLDDLARWQIDGYTRIVAEWSQHAASTAGETCAVPFDNLARVLVDSVMGLVLHYLADHDQARARRDLEALIEMLIGLAAVRPAPSRSNLSSEAANADRKTH